MVVRSKDGDIEAIDFRGAAAALSNVTMFVNNRNLALRVTQGHNNGVRLILLV